LRLELSVCELGAPFGQRRLDRLFCRVDLGAARALLLGGKRAERLQLLGDEAGLAEIARLRVLELGGSGGTGEIRPCLFNHRGEIVHRSLQRSKAAGRRKDWRAAEFTAARAGSHEVRPNLLDDRTERSRIVDRHVGEDLAIDIDRCFLQAGHELAVRDAETARRRIDAGDPELAKDTLLGAAVAVGVLAGAHDRFLGDAKDVLATAAESLGKG
jgi:hypothetical protein